MQAEDSTNLSVQFSELAREYEENEGLDLQAFGWICHANAVQKGFWDNPLNPLIEKIQNDPSVNLPNAIKQEILQALQAAGGRNPGEMIALEMSELGERLEAVREVTDDGGPAMSTKIPGFTLEEEEAADTLIRLLDYCVGRKLRLTQAAISKLAYNLKRPHKHGRAF